MRKIKTRERVKNIKVLDKAAVVRERMKAAFIRSKEKSKGLAENKGENPEEYAVENVQAIQEDVALGTGYAAKSGISNAVKKAEEKARNPNLNTPQTTPCSEYKKSVVPADVSILGEYSAEASRGVLSDTATENMSPAEKGRILTAKKSQKMQAEKVRLHREERLKHENIYYAGESSYIEQKTDSYRNPKSSKSIRTHGTRVGKREEPRPIKNAETTEKTIKFAEKTHHKNRRKAHEKGRRGKRNQNSRMLCLCSRKSKNPWHTARSKNSAESLENGGSFGKIRQEGFGGCG